MTNKDSSVKVHSTSLCLFKSMKKCRNVSYYVTLLAIICIVWMTAEILFFKQTKADSGLFCLTT